MRRIVFIIIFAFFFFPKAAYAAYCTPETELSNQMKPYFIPDGNYYGYTSQGMCVAGDDIIYTRFKGDYSPTTYVILDAKTKKEVAHQEFYTLHSNSLTYNPDKKEVVSVSRNHAYVFRFENHTLTLKNTYLLNHNCCKISYVPSKKMYYLATSTVIYSSTDCSTLTPVFRVPRIAIDQGMGFDGNSFYIVWYNVGKNYIYQYSLEGELKNKYTLFSDTYREIEEVDFYQDKMILNIANSGNKNGLYTVKAKHDYGTSEILKKPTCGKSGKKITVCKRCGNEKKETIPATGKHKETDWILSKKPSCETSGERYKKCKICKQITKTEILKEKGHRYSEWNTEIEPTVLETGMGLRKCIDCQKQEYITLKKLPAFAKFFVKKFPLQWHQTFQSPEVSMNDGDMVKSWKSMNPSVVSVSDDGLLTAKKHGKTTICVETMGGAKNSFLVDVQYLPIWIQDISVPKRAYTLRVGKTSQIMAEKYPISSWNKIRYYSNDPEIVEVTKDGKLYGKKEGYTTIHISSFRISKEVLVSVEGV